MAFKNKDDFKTHTEQHIQNVIELSNVAFRLLLKDKKLREKYEIHSKQQAKDFEEKLLEVIKTHDSAKTTESDSFLLQYNLDVPFYETLFKSSGKELNSKDDKTIKKLNDLDAILTNDSLSSNNFNYREKQLYYFIEKISDIVDRGSNPLSKIEFGREMTLASEYKPEEQEKSDLLLIKRLERYYEKNIYPRQIDLGVKLGVLDSVSHTLELEDEFSDEFMRTHVADKFSDELKNPKPSSLINPNKKPIIRGISKSI